MADGKLNPCASVVLNEATFWLVLPFISFSYFQPCHKNGDPKKGHYLQTYKKELGLHCKLHNLMPSTRQLSAVISNGHSIDEQILVYLSRVYCTDSSKMGTFILTKTKLFIFTRYLSSKIDIILRKNLNLVRVLLFLCACKLSV